MKDYSHYKAYDLLQDDEFLEYCLRHDEESVRMWDRLVRADRALAEEVEKAQQFIRNIHHQEQRMRPEEKVQVWEAIRRNCRESFRLLYRISTVAACLLLTLATAFWLYRMQAEKALTAIELVGKPAETGSEVLLVLADRQEKLIAAEKTALNYDSTGRISIRTDSLTEEATIINEQQTAVFHQLLVPAGKRSSITFSEGTKIWVNANSRVVYPAEFEKEKREIYVEGEVFLEVAENVDRPFYVRTQEFEVRVLGTSFGIRAYEDEMEQGVVLVSGKVNVKTKDRQETVLTPNDRYVLQNGKPVVKLVDVYEYISWKDGVLCFERSCIGDILTRLEKYYGVEIDYTSEVKGISCSGKLELKNDLKEVLESLTKTAPIRYESVDNKIKVMKKEKESMK